MSEHDPDGTTAVASFDDLLRPDDSSPSDPHTDAEHDAAAAAQPTAPEAEARQPETREPDDERSPFIPRQRFDEVNTKLKEAKTWREQYAWAEGLQPEAVQTMREWFGKAAADPRAFALNLLDELSQHPDHAASVRSELAKRLGTRGTGPAEAVPETIEPEVVITDDKGREVGKAFSDRQVAQLLQQQRDQVLSEVDTRYKDRFSALDQIQQRERETQEASEANNRATALITELSQKPLFDAHKTEIGKWIQAHPPESDHPAHVAANLYKAYLEIVGPKLGSGQQTSSTVLADLQRKARASTGVNPGTASSASPKAPASFFDAGLEW